MCLVDSPMYLQSKTDAQLAQCKSSVWFDKQPLGANSLGRFLPKACEFARISPRGNHGVFASAVQRLCDAEVPDDQIIQIIQFYII